MSSREKKKCFDYLLRVLQSISITVISGDQEASNFLDGYSQRVAGGRNHLCEASVVGILILVHGQDNGFCVGIVIVGEVHNGMVWPVHSIDHYLIADVVWPLLDFVGSVLLHLFSSG